MGMSRHEQLVASPLLSSPAQVTAVDTLPASSPTGTFAPSHAAGATISSGDEQVAQYAPVVVQSLRERRLHLDLALARFAEQADELATLAGLLVETLSSGHKVLVAGNGGSAAEAQHFAAELVGRFKRERSPYPVLPLTTDTATLTAVANDYGYAEVFARQVHAFGQCGDLLLAFSTSGESENLVRAAQVGREHLMTVCAITGERASRLERLSHTTVRVPHTDTPLVQELHMIITHILCDLIETQLVSLATSLDSQLSQFDEHEQ
jgi:D-sedoheptulose 7-phosphate isomerase